MLNINEDYGYKVTDIARTRHSCLAKAVKGHGYDKVLDALRKRKSRCSKTYKKSRYRADINYLRRRR